MTRTVAEWIGKTDDTRPPPRVRLRVLDAHGGICALSGRKIQAGDEWDLDHITALINGGENRESNLQPVLRSAHRKKTSADVKLKAKVDRVRKKHLGLHKSKNPMPGGRDSKIKKKMTGEVVPRNPEDDDILGEWF